MQLCGSLSILWHCLSLGLEWKLPFSSPVATAEFSKFAECSTFTASSFRIWNSSTGIPSPPLALFVVMLPKAHLTSHSRMSGSRWVITPSWLSRFCFCVENLFGFLPSVEECLTCSCYDRKAEWLKANEKAELRAGCRGRNYIIVRPLAFTLQEMQSHFKVLSKGVTWSNSCFKIIILATFWE